MTRSTGRGDNENVGMCAACYDLAGEENSLLDTGSFYSSPESILDMIDFIASKGGDASAWDDLKSKALEAMPKPADKKPELIEQYDPVFKMLGL
jgi:hypothetical protein